MINLMQQKSVSVYAFVALHHQSFDSNFRFDFGDLDIRGL
jgi:hypothetical protein